MSQLSVQQLFVKAEYSGDWSDLQIELVRRWDAKSPGDTAARFSTIRRLYNADVSRAGDKAVGRK